MLAARGKVVIRMSPTGISPRVDELLALLWSNHFYPSFCAYGPKTATLLIPRIVLGFDWFIRCDGQDREAAMYRCVSEAVTRLMTLE